MPTDVVMPQMGESIFEGTITKWLKKPGEKVQRDEPLFEISTDKVDAEIPAPASGVLQEIKVPEGNTVQVNTVVGVIGEANGASASAAPAKTAAPPAPVAASSASPKTSAPTPPAPAPASDDEDASDVRSSPLVRKLARENNVDLAKLSGSGTGGRVTKQDVLDFVEHRVSAPAAVPTAPAPRQAAAPAPAVIPGDLVPMSQMRKIISQRMIESRRTSAHVHCMFEVDLTRIVNLRNKLKSGFEQRHGARLTFMPFFVRAAIIALQQYPIVNSSLEGDNIRYHKHVNAGIAFALSASVLAPKSSCRPMSKARPSPSPILANSAQSSACPSSTSRT